MKKLFLAVGLALFLVPTLAGAATNLQVVAQGKVKGQTTDCAGIAQGCLSAAGTFKGRPMTGGTFTAKFTVDWTRAKKVNGATCASGGGSVDLAGKAGDALSLTATGTLCKGGSSSYPYRFNGHYNIVAGGGKYATDGVGSGNVSWQKLPGTRLNLNVVGSLKMTARPPQ